MFVVCWSQVVWCSGRYLDGVLVATLVVRWSLYGPRAIGQPRERAAPGVAEPDRLVGPGQDGEDYHGGGEQGAGAEQDPAPRVTPGPGGLAAGWLDAARRDGAGLGQGHRCLRGH
jgi:hypothetical protein